MHGSSRGRVFKKIDIAAEDVTNVRMLQLPLVNAERYWAYAMELKEESVDHHDEPRKLYHSLRRLAKAAQWARKLKDFAAKLADDITALEADAYCSTMEGLLALDKEDWESAFTHFSRSKTIYEKLGEVSKGSQRDLLIQRAEETVQHIRYCEYNLSREGKSVEVSCVKCHLSTIVTIVMRQFEDKCHNCMHYSVNVVSKSVYQGSNVFFLGVLSNHVIAGTI